MDASAVIFSDNDHLRGNIHLLFAGDNNIVVMVFQPGNVIFCGNAGINNNKGSCLRGKTGDNLFEGTGLADIAGEDFCSFGKTVSI